MGEMIDTCSTQAQGVLNLMPASIGRQQHQKRQNRKARGRHLHNAITLPLSAEPLPNTQPEKQAGTRNTRTTVNSRQACPPKALNHTAESQSHLGWAGKPPVPLSLGYLCPLSSSLFPSPSLRNIFSSIHMLLVSATRAINHLQTSCTFPARDTFHHVLGSFVSASLPCLAPFLLCSQQSRATRTEWKTHRAVQCSARHLR